jgi:hypothetical protein
MLNMDRFYIDADIRILGIIFTWPIKHHIMGYIIHGQLITGRVAFGWANFALTEYSKIVM